MTAPPNYNPADPDKMDLPVGVKCGDCIHMPRCKAIFSHVESDTRCDWSPSRYHPTEPTDCPHAAPFRYCETCKVSPCPVGLGKP